MDHVLQALDEHIAHQEWLLKLEKAAKETAEQERDAVINDRDDARQTALRLKADNERLDCANKALVEKTDSQRDVIVTLRNQLSDYSEKAECPNFPKYPIGYRIKQNDNPDDDIVVTAHLYQTECGEETECLSEQEIEQEIHDNARP